MEPFTTAALAAALTTLVNGAAGEAGKATWTSLTSFVRSKFAPDSEPTTALAAVERAPADQESAQQLALVLQEVARTDHAAATWLNPWFDHARAATQTTAPVNNVISGQAQLNGPLVQGHTFNGTIHF